MIKQSKLPKSAQKVLELYLKLPFEHTQPPCPYWVNRLSKNIRGPFSGKGTPRQIVHTTLIRARMLGVKISDLSDQKLVKFMNKNRIGVDCSGFVFHLVNKINIQKTGVGIADKLLENNSLPNWRAAWRCNADLLTSIRFTKKVKLEHVRAGDLIRVMDGKHLLIIIGVKNNEITYAHSSYLSTKESGVHLSKINIMDYGNDLSKQHWIETTIDDKNYGAESFNKQKGDSIRRFKWW